MAAARALLAAAADAFDAVDILVYNAGIRHDESFTTIEESDWDAAIEVHLKGTFAVTAGF